MFSLNRVVALATPVFSAAAAAGSAWLLKHFPGVPVPSAAEIVSVEVTVASSAAAAALKWLHGHQKYEQRIDEAEKAAIGVVDTVTDVVEKASPPVPLTAVPADPDAAAKLKAELTRVEGLLADARAAIEGQAPPAVQTAAVASS